VLAVSCIPSGANDNRIGRSEPALQTDNDIVTEEPNWNPSSIDRNARVVESGDYTVAPGDTLLGIAIKTGAPFEDIVRANNLSEPYPLSVGQTLTIPSGTYHSVSAGETGIAIARAYGVPWSDIVEINDLEAPYILRVGQRLKLPSSLQNTNGVKNGVEQSTGSLTNAGDLTPEQRASAFDIGIDDIVTGGAPAQATAASSSSAAGLSSSIPEPGVFNGDFIYPIRGRTLSRFGSKGGGRKNDGINIAGAAGDPIGAAAPGVVVYSGDEIDVFGGLILIDHGQGWVSAYGHVGKINVVRGQKVNVGQNIGEVGQTGYVDRPQLHFEIRKDRKPLDPLGKLPNN